MASLVIQSNGFSNQVFTLKPGTNRFGRSPANDFQIVHPTISHHHCDLELQAEGLIVRDCGSTNGTFLEGKRIQVAQLSAGQFLRLGDVELLVETTEVTVAIPTFEVPRPAPPVVLPDGSFLCSRHPDARVTHQCTHCHQMLCDACVHRLRRRGGRLWTLCGLCSYPCEPLGGQKKKKKFLFGLLPEELKLPFRRRAKKN